MKKYTGTVGYIWKQLIRKKVFTVLAILIPAISIISTCQISAMIRNNQETIQTVYENAEIRCTVIKKDGTEGSGSSQNLIHTVIEDLVNAGYIEDVNAEPIFRCHITVGDRLYQNDWIRGVMSMEGFKEIHQLGGVAIQWLEGYDETFFRTGYENTEEYAQEPAAVVSEYFAAAEGLGLGDTIDQVQIDGAAVYEDVRIVGLLSGSVTEGTVLVPYDVMEQQLECRAIDVLYFKEIYFSIHHEWNNRLETVTEWIQQRLNRTDATMLKELQVLVFDEEVKIAVKPLEQTMKVLEILKPFLIAVFCLCEAGVTGLFITLRKKELSIMRMLGTPKGRILFVLSGEQLLTGILGTVAGIGVSALLIREGTFLAGSQILLGVGLTVISVLTIWVMFYYIRRERL